VLKPFCGSAEAKYFKVCRTAVFLNPTRCYRRDRGPNNVKIIYFCGSVDANDKFCRAAFISNSASCNCVKALMNKRQWLYFIIWSSVIIDWRTGENVFTSCQPEGCRQNLHPPSGPPFLDPLLDPFLDPSIFSVKIKKDNRLKLDKVCVLHTTASFALKFCSLQYSVKRRFPLDTTHFQDYFFSIYERIRNFSWVFRWPVPTGGVARHMTRSHARWGTVSWDLHL